MAPASPKQTRSPRSVNIELLQPSLLKERSLCLPLLRGESLRSPALTNRFVGAGFLTDQLRQGGVNKRIAARNHLQASP